MTTHNTHFDGNFAGFGSSDRVIAPKTAADSAPQSDSLRSDSSTVVLVLTYIIGLAALAVVALTGQFPWFMMALAAGAAIASAIPTMAAKDPGARRQNVISA